MKTQALLVALLLAVGSLGDAFHLKGKGSARFDVQSSTPAGGDSLGSYDSREDDRSGGQQGLAIGAKLGGFVQRIRSGYSVKHESKGHGYSFNVDQQHSQGEGNLGVQQGASENQQSGYDRKQGAVLEGIKSGFSIKHDNKDHAYSINIGKELGNGRGFFNRQEGGQTGNEERGLVENQQEGYGRKQGEAVEAIRNEYRIQHKNNDYGLIKFRQEQGQSYAGRQSEQRGVFLGKHLGSLGEVQGINSEYSINHDNRENGYIKSGEEQGQGLAGSMSEQGGGYFGNHFRSLGGSEVGGIKSEYHIHHEYKGDSNNGAHDQRQANGQAEGGHFGIRLGGHFGSRQGSSVAAEQRQEAGLIQQRTSWHGQGQSGYLGVQRQDSENQQTGYGKKFGGLSEGIKSGYSIKHESKGHSYSLNVDGQEAAAAGAGKAHHVQSYTHGAGLGHGGHKGESEGRSSEGLAAGGKSFIRFHGPVEGQEQLIHATVADKHGKTTDVEDYVAHPKYQFEYGVEDPHSGDFKQQKETRDGDHVEGEYSLTEPDGNIRTVKYTVDKDSGFQAIVSNSKHGQ